jgi:hypothetical protein
MLFAAYQAQIAAWVMMVGAVLLLIGLVGELKRPRQVNASVEAKDSKPWADELSNDDAPTTIRTLPADAANGGTDRRRLDPRGQARRISADR